MIDAYPLHWPAGWPREQYPEYSRFETSLAKARDGLRRELELLGASDIVISCNAALLKGGQIAARQPRLDDTGVAVYFTLDRQERCIPCDKWVYLEDNIHAIELTVKALRGLERWGTHQIVEAAFRGFAALPAGSNGGWWTVLELAPTASKEEIEAAYRRLVRQHHPDVGGNAEDFHRLTVAYEQATKGR